MSKKLFCLLKFAASPPLPKSATLGSKILPYMDTTFARHGSYAKGAIFLLASGVKYPGSGTNCVINKIVLIYK